MVTKISSRCFPKKIKQNAWLYRHHILSYIMRSGKYSTIKVGTENLNIGRLEICEPVLRKSFFRRTIIIFGKSLPGNLEVLLKPESLEIMNYGRTHNVCLWPDQMPSSQGGDWVGISLIKKPGDRDNAEKKLNKAQNKVSY